MKIAIGTDHRGFLQKEFIKQEITSIEWVDVGTISEERTDYPLFAEKVVSLMQQKDVTYGVLLCGSGGGMAIAANRYPYIYAVVAWNAEVARRCKEEDNANIVVIPSDFVTLQEVIIIIEQWLTAQFKEGRYAQRLNMIDK